jgi:hypothetical protein
MFKNLRELIATMPDEKTCREYLVKQRWNDKPICPYCFCDKTYVIENGKRFKCGNKDCYKKFSVTVGTIFEASNIPLNKWFMAIYLCTAHKKGISSYQLGKDIGVAQKNAWFMLHRIREMMRTKHETKLKNTVECDEVYMGGKVSNMSKKKRTFLRENDLVGKTKTAVMGMIERKGNLKLVTVGKNTSANSLLPAVYDNIHKDATLITDSSPMYKSMNKMFAQHEVVNHIENEYVRDKQWHTNTIEGAFSMLKRSIYGIYHQVTPKHLSRYCDETAFRYNLRKMKDAERFNFSLTQIEGRLTYKHLVERTKEESIDIQPIVVPEKWTRDRTILQIKDGKIVATFKTIASAAKAIGVKDPSLRQALTGKSKSCGGYEWRYE